MSETAIEMAGDARRNPKIGAAPPAGNFDAEDRRQIDRPSVRAD
jgi:hypothetical protein